MRMQQQQQQSYVWLLGGSGKIAEAENNVCKSVFLIKPSLKFLQICRNLQIWRHGPQVAKNSQK